MEIEKNILRSNKRDITSWVGLHPQTLQNPYDEILEIMSYLKRENVKRFLDIGSAYSRIGLVLNQLILGIEFVGYEIRKERHLLAQMIYDKYNISGELINRDILKELNVIQKFDCLLVYDFSSPAQIELLLKTISNL